MDAARQHRVEMRHQLDIVAVVAAEIFQAVSEVLATREMLLEAGEAARQRMSPRVDDLRVRQDQLDQPDMQEVVRHLVDEERPAELAMDARALDILLAQCAELIGAHARERIVIGGRLPVGVRRGAVRA